MELIIRGLNKVYPNGLQALNSLSLNIQSGLFGLLGPNGAGKSTLMRTLATLQSVDSGEVFFGDINILKDKQSIREILGYLPQDFGVYRGVSAEKLLHYYAMLKGIVSRSSRQQCVNDLLQQVNLYDVRKSYVHQFSGGMRQRFGIAQALIGNPKLIIVDEPTAGLDPSERVRFNNLLSEVSEDRVVILSTHIVDDVADLCQDMAILNQGELALQGEPEKLIEMMQGLVWEKSIERREYDRYCDQYRVIHARLKGGSPLIHVYSTEKPGLGFESVMPSLEDVYFNTIA